MYIGSSNLLKEYDATLLDNGYSIVELVDFASDCLISCLDNNLKYTIICGPGNNGADGLSLAIKLLAQGNDVEVYILNQTDISMANDHYLTECLNKGISPVLLNDDLSSFKASVTSSDVIVDAMFGFGLHSSPRNICAKVIEIINELDKEVVAVDIPTGLDCNTGVAYHPCVKANKTITLTAIKNGFLNPESKLYTGDVTLKNLTTPSFHQEVGLYESFNFENAKKIIKDRIYDGHKTIYGKVGMFVGCDEYKGAALLSTKSAVYAGSGLVTLISTEKVNNQLPTVCLEATTKLRPNVISSSDIESYDALLVGSGLGLSDTSERCVTDIVYQSNVPVVLDGDALTIMSRRIDMIDHKHTILTPHMGEFKRLCQFNDKDDILQVASEFALKHHCVLVLKGPHTIVTNGMNNYRINAGNKAMSVAGMGDTLAGIIASFVGQGYSNLEAALLGAYIHSHCADILAEDNYSVIPSALIQLIPQVMKQMINEKMK